MDSAVKASPSPQYLERRLLAGGYRYVDADLEKRCTKCGDYWPADSEFFYRAKAEPDGLMCHCRACVEERKRMKRENLTVRKESSEMSNPTRDEILNLLRQRPGLRALQISDLLDIDLPVVEGQLLLAERDKQVLSEKVTAPNGQHAMAYTVNSAFLGWKAPASGAAKPSHTEVEAAREDVERQQATQESQTSDASCRLSLADRAISFLTKNGPATAAQLKEVLGISYAVTTVLQVALTSGAVKRIGKIYCVPDRAGFAPTGQSIAATAISSIESQAESVEKDTEDGEAAPAHAPAPHSNGGMQIIDLLRAKLTTEEFRGYLKGSIISHTLADAPDQAGRNFLAAGELVQQLTALANLPALAAATV